MYSCQKGQHYFKKSFSKFRDRAFIHICMKDLSRNIHMTGCEKCLKIVIIIQSQIWHTSGKCLKIVIIIQSQIWHTSGTFEQPVVIYFRSQTAFRSSSSGLSGRLLIICIFSRKKIISLDLILIISPSLFLGEVRSGITTEQSERRARNDAAGKNFPR